MASPEEMSAVINWTQILITLITVAGTTLSAIFAARARGASGEALTHAVKAKQSADVAVAASLAPPYRKGDGAGPESMIKIPVHARTPTIPDVDVILPPGNDDEGPHER